MILTHRNVQKSLDRNFSLIQTFFRALDTKHHSAVLYVEAI